MQLSEMHGTGRVKKVKAKIQRLDCIKLYIYCTVKYAEMQESLKKSLSAEFFFFSERSIVAQDLFLLCVGVFMFHGSFSHDWKYVVLLFVGLEV